MVGVFIGRFQPLHSGHIAALSQAASRCKHLVILVGSADACRSVKNPWSYEDRKYMIEKAMRSAGVNNVRILPLNDYPYNDPQWITDVRETVESVKEYTEYGKITLFGHWKEGNDYLRWFPDWNFQDLQATVHMNATQVRERMFRESDPAMPLFVKNDWDYYEAEKQKFASYPFPETLNFNCGDAVVECQGYVLLVQRGKTPGRGTWALPGGFKNRAETFRDCAFRELMEETTIKVPEKVLRGSLVKEQLFDSPKRSFGINRNTLAIYVRIQPDQDGGLPKVKAADDAMACKWVPLNEALNYLELYDDHKSIISSLPGVMPRPAYLVR